MMIYITKWALTEGIIEAELLTPDVKPGRLIEAKWAVDRRSFFHGAEWHLTYHAAIARAVHMREAKLRSLKKQYDRVEDLKFR